MIDLFEELRAVTGVLEDAGIPYALVGGLAYSAWVEVRATEDIDLLIGPQDWERVQNALAPSGYLALSNPMDFPDIRIRRLTRIENEDVAILDLLLADTPELEEGINAAVEVNFADRKVRVARPRVIVHLKRGRMSAKDRDDIEGLERIMGGNQ